jgi:hypothetical protein
MIISKGRILQPAASSGVETGPFEGKADEKLIY